MNTQDVEGQTLRGHASSDPRRQHAVHRRCRRMPAHCISSRNEERPVPRGRHQTASTQEATPNDRPGISPANGASRRQSCPPSPANQLTQHETIVRQDQRALLFQGRPHKSIRICGVFTPRRLEPPCFHCRWRAPDTSVRTVAGACRRASAFGFAAAGARHAWSTVSADAWRSAC